MTFSLTFCNALFTVEREGLTLFYAQERGGGGGCQGVMTVHIFNSQLYRYAFIKAGNLNSPSISHNNVSIIHCEILNRNRNLRKCKIIYTSIKTFFVVFFFQ